MMTVDKLREIASREQTTELNVRREYVQQVFLSHFYQRSGSDKMYFKGGTALRIVFNSPRFSEDLDFSVGQMKAAEIEAVIIAGLKEVEREGIKCEIGQAKETSGGYLAELWLTVAGERVGVLLQFSGREKEIKGEVVTISGSLVLPYILVMLKREDLVREKIAALLSRNKPRDYFDLYFMLRSGLVGREERSQLGLVKARLATMAMDFYKELKLFLPRSHWPVLRDFKQSLTREIERLGVGPD